MKSIISPMFYDITEWQEKRFFQTKGTRDKCVVQNHDGYYYFKTSFNQGDRNYVHEFWSEIIASTIGQYLGFNTLDYFIARKEDKIGCLSKQMNDKNSSLIEGMSLLTGYDNTYNANKNSYNRYTLKFIYEALESYNVKFEEFNKMIIFDYIIGNSDRHQENWGFISQTRTDFLHKSYYFTRKNRNLKWLLKGVIPSKIRSKISRSLINSQFNEFAPIYDSGSSLVRELTEEKVDEVLSNKEMFNGIINRAKSEIRKSNGVKYKQKELVQEILKKDPTTFNNVKNSLLLHIDLEQLKKIIFNIDENLPDNLSAHCLPNNRKQLIFNLISERINLLIKI